MKKSIFVSVLVFSAALVLVGCNSNPNEPEGGGSANGHKYVDLGLSVKWATMNVGATTPTATAGDLCGLYYLRILPSFHPNPK